MVNIQNFHPEPSKQNLYIVTKTQQSANTNTSAPTTKDKSGATDYASRSPRGCFGLVLHRAYRV